MDRRKVYYYRWPGEPKFSGLAVDVHMRDDELWFLSPPDHPHMQPGEVVRDIEGGFVFRCDGYKPGEWIFKELTIEEFRRWIYRHVGMGEAIAAKIRTTEDFYEWYRKAFHFPTKKLYR